MYRDASHLWRSFSHNRTKINIQFLSETICPGGEVMVIIFMHTLTWRMVAISCTCTYVPEVLSRFDIQVHTHVPEVWSPLGPVFFVGVPPLLLIQSHWSVWSWRQPHKLLSKSYSIWATASLGGVSISNFYEISNNDSRNITRTHNLGYVAFLVQNDVLFEQKLFHISNKTTGVLLMGTETFF